MSAVRFPVYGNGRPCMQNGRPDPLRSPASSNRPPGPPPKPGMPPPGPPPQHGCPPHAVPPPPEAPPSPGGHRPPEAQGKLQRLFSGGLERGDLLMLAILYLVFSENEDDKLLPLLAIGLYLFLK